MSSRIFLSATTSPVNLFLALYTTPYVPSPIFSTFWKFSMERASEAAQAPRERGPGTLTKAGPTVGAEDLGDLASTAAPSSGWNASRAQPLTICPT